jgi:PII-like signaling protein
MTYAAVFARGAAGVRGATVLRGIWAFTATMRRTAIGCSSGSGACPW